MWVKIFVSAIANLYGNRVRGGLYALPGGDLTARALGVLPVGLMALWLGWGWPWALGAFAAALAGAMLAGSGGAYSMTGGARDWALMALYAVERLTLLAVVITLHTGASALILLAAIPVCPACYWLARFWPINVPWLGIKAASGVNAGGKDAAFGEALFGAAHGALLIFAMKGF